MRMRIGMELALCAGAVFGQAPAVSPGGIVNHFSYALPGMPNSGIAQGSIFDIYGTNIGPATLTQAQGFPLPSALASTSVQVTVSGTTTNVLLFFVASGQIAGLLPSRTPVGTGTLTVTLSGQRSAPSPITVVARSVGILSLAQNGQGAAVMQVGSGSGEVVYNSVTRSAQSGQVGVFYGTGLGAVPFDESRGAPFLNIEPSIQVFVGGKPAKVLFQGRVPGLAGLDQFNVEIPEGVSGCYITVWFQTGTIISNLTTISVSPGPSCPDPIVSSGSWAGTGTLKAASLRLVRVKQKIAFGAAGPLDYTGDIASMAFSATDLSKVQTGTQPIPATIIGNCIVSPLVQQTNIGTGVADAVAYLNGGPGITLRGPNGVKQLDRFPTGFAAQLGSTAFAGQVPVPPPPYLSPGVYTVDNGGGSAEVPAFSVSITLPNPEFAWSSADQTTVTQRAQGMEVTWTGGDAGGAVDIAGVSRLAKSATQPVAAGAQFSCRVPASAGRFRVPPEVLLFLPPTVGVSGVPSGTVTVAHTVTAVEFPLAGFQFSDLVFVSSVTRSLEFR